MREAAFPRLRPAMKRALAGKSIIKSMNALFPNPFSLEKREKLRKNTALQ